MNDPDSANPSDAELLFEYIHNHSERAFATFTHRHVDVVYSTAMRRTGGDHHCAQEVTHMVFLTLANRASTLLNHPSIAGWLHTCARHMTMKLRRDEARRASFEHRAAEELALHTGAAAPALQSMDADWDRIKPVVDDALDNLGHKDREAIMLRYLYDSSYAEIARRLGMSEKAAWIRVERALEKLRKQLTGKGVTSSATALGAVLTSKAVGAAPAGLAASVCASVTNTATASGGVTALTGATGAGTGIAAIAAAAIKLFVTGNAIILTAGGMAVTIAATMLLWPAKQDKTPARSQTVPAITADDLRNADREKKAFDLALAPDPHMSGGAMKQIMDSRNQAIDAKDAKALIALGKKIMSEAALHQYKKIAATLFDDAARLGDTEGMMLAGRCAETGFGVGTDPKRAIEYYLEAAEAGLVDGYTAAAKTLLEGKKEAADLDTALVLIDKALEKGSIEAKYLKGTLLLAQNSDVQMALNCLMDAARADFADAQLALGRLYKEGKFLPKDNQASAEWIKYAADIGSASANAIYGKALLQSGYEWSDVAIDKLQRAANDGSAQAAMQLYDLSRLSG